MIYDVNKSRLYLDENRSIATHSPISHLFLSCLGKSEKINFFGKTYYINKNSFQNYSNNNDENISQSISNLVSDQIINKAKESATNIDQENKIAFWFANEEANLFFRAKKPKGIDSLWEINSYRPTKQLGEGAFGQVNLLKSNSKDKKSKVAKFANIKDKDLLKRLSHEAQNNANEMLEKEMIFTNLFNEAGLKNIQKPHKALITNRDKHILVETKYDSSLADLVNKLTYLQKISAMDQLIEALKQIHAYKKFDTENELHQIYYINDIQLGNILVKLTADEIKCDFSDFSMVKCFDEFDDKIYYKQLEEANLGICLKALFTGDRRTYIQDLMEIKQLKRNLINHPDHFQNALNQFFESVHQIADGTRNIQENERIKINELLTGLKKFQSRK